MKDVEENFSGTKKDMKKFHKSEHISPFVLTGDEKANEEKLESQLA